MVIITDWICNWYGSQLVVNSINYTDSAKFQSTALSEYEVDGKSYGQFKTAGNLNFLRVYEAGHEVPYYRESLRPFPFLVPCFLSLNPQWRRG